jgi:hypothetical protein
VRDQDLCAHAAKPRVAAHDGRTGQWQAEIVVDLAKPVESSRGHRRLGVAGEGGEEIDSTGIVMA